MPWKECSVMDDRLQFVVRRLAGEPMAELCREFGISRKTGHKIFHRYQECGIQGLTDRSRRPYRYAHQLLLLYLRSFFASAVYPPTCAATTVCPLPLGMPCLT